MQQRLSISERWIKSNNISFCDTTIMKLIHIGKLHFRCVSGMLFFGPGQLLLEARKMGRVSQKIACTIIILWHFADSMVDVHILY